MRNMLEFSRYVWDEPMEWLNHMAHYFEYYELLEHEKVAMASYHTEGKAY